MTENIRFAADLDKLCAAVVYLAESSIHDDAFGAAKLVKLLYFADCAAYLRRGKPITGCAYLRMEHGPYPQDWAATERMLERNGIVRVVEESITGGYRRQRWLPLQPSDPAALTDAERGILDEQLRRFADFNAAQIEEYSYAEVGWRSARPGAVIPYNLAGFRMPPPPDAETRARGQRIADTIREKGYRPANDITPKHRLLPDYHNRAV